VVVVLVVVVVVSVVVVLVVVIVLVIFYLAVLFHQCHLGVGEKSKKVVCLLIGKKTQNEIVSNVSVFRSQLSAFLIIVTLPPTTHLTV